MSRTRRKPSKHRRIDSLLRQSKGRILSQVGQQMRELETLRETLHAALPEELRPHCRAIRIDTDRTLVLAASSAAWLHRLRFCLPALQAALREADTDIRSIRAFTLPPDSAEEEPDTLPPPQMSAATARLLTDSAEHTEHPRLKKVLRELSGNTVSPTIKPTIKRSPD